MHDLTHLLGGAAGNSLACVSAALPCPSLPEERQVAEAQDHRTRHRDTSPSLASDGERCVLPCFANYPACHSPLPSCVLPCFAACLASHFPLFSFRQQAWHLVQACLRSFSWWVMCIAAFFCL